MHEDITEHIAYDKGYQEAKYKYMNNLNWIKIEDDERTFPEQGRRLLYFFEGTGISLGFYYGRDEDYPDPNNHVFGSNAGFLTGDVTHYCYISYPDAEEAVEWRIEADKEFFEETKKEIFKMKEPMTQEQIDSVRESSFGR